MSEAIAIVAGVLTALIGVIYTALTYEIRKLREKTQEHANRIQEHDSLIHIIRKKLDL